MPTADRVATGAAPGKVLWFGEYAALLGHPALGAPLSIGARVQVRPGRGRIRHPKPTGPAGRLGARDRRTLEAMRQRLFGPLTLDLDIDLELPARSGLGSSAAIALALIRARDEWHNRKPPRRALVWATATNAEALAHGQSSGADPAFCLASGPSEFRAGKALRLRPIPMGRAVHLVVASPGPHDGTNRGVHSFLALQSRHKKAVGAAVEGLGQAARMGRAALARGAWDDLGAACRLAHGILFGLGRVSPALHDLVALAESAGARGAKLSGAGGKGGTMIAFADTDARARRIAKALTARARFVHRERYPAR